jgi:hypothetical protein
MYGNYPTIPGCIPTMSNCTIIPTCWTATPAGGQAQTLISAATACPTVPPMCHPMLSQPPHCPTVAPMCPPAANAGGQAQAQATGILCIVTTGCTGIPVVCNSAQAQTMVSVPPHCPTVAPMCPPPAQYGGQAQAQATGILCAITTGCTGIPVVCSSQAQAQTMLSVPPYCPTVAPMCPPAANAGGQAQAQAQATGILCAITTGCTGIPVVCGSAQAQTMLSVPPHCPTVAPMCPPPAQYGGQAEAQATGILCAITTGCTGIPVVCNSAQVGSQAQAQAQATGILCVVTTGCTGIPVVCNSSQAQAQTMVSVPPHCPTVAPMCPPPAQVGGQAQAQATGILCAITTGCTGIPVVCGSAQAQAQATGILCIVTTGCTGIPVVCNSAQAQTMVSVPPHCPTVAPMCPPPAQFGGQAQAQATGILCVVTTGCTGIPVVCNSAQAGAQAGGQAQAQATGILCAVTTGCTGIPVVCNSSQAYGQMPVSVPPHCPTVAPMCPPPAQFGGQAQAQATGILCAVTTGCTGIIFIC